MNADFGAAPTPMSRIVNGGRAGGVRLRLMLALLWMAGGGDERHTVKFPARSWAELLDLTDPGDAGERRTRSAFAWLQGEKLIASERDPGKAPLVTLRREDGSGEPYVAPIHAPKDKTTGKLARQDWNVRLPPTFWANAWPLILHTPGLALLLVMLDMRRSDRAPAWVSPGQRDERYGISEDTFSRGVTELEAHGIVTVWPELIDESFDIKRRRNKYELNIGRLDAPPDWGDA